MFCITFKYSWGGVGGGVRGWVESQEITVVQRQKQKIFDNQVRIDYKYVIFITTNVNVVTVLLSLITDISFFSWFM